MNAPKQATQEVKEELIDLINNKKSTIILQNGKKVKVGYIIGDTQDKIDTLIVEYERYKKSMKPINSPKEGEEAQYDEATLNKANKVTRQFYSKCAAAILINSYFGLKLRWWFKWRWLYHFSRYTGTDYLNIIVEAKKKAQEQEYSTAMILLMDMTTTWTTMTKKEAEEYRLELELAREHQSLKSSKPSDSH